MIFYIALDDEGRRQLRGTQADAKAVNRNFEQIDIPTDKTGLMAFVQKLYDEQAATEAHLPEEREEQPVYGPPLVETAPPPEAELPEEDAENFDARVLEEQVASLGMLGATGLDRFDGWTELTGISAAFARGVALLNVLTADDHQMAKLFLRDRLTKRRRFG